MPQVLYNDICNDFLNNFLKYLSEDHDFIIPWIILIIFTISTRTLSSDSYYYSCNDKLNHTYLGVVFSWEVIQLIRIEYFSWNGLSMII